MDKTHAKQLLRAHREDVPDTSREMAEALSLVNHDPSLKEWFLEQRRFNKTIQGKLRETTVPNGLKERILATQNPVIPLWRKQILKYAAAAAIVGLLTAAIIWLPGGNEAKTFAGFQSRMVSFALREYRMDIVSEDSTAIRQFLQKQGAPADYILPSSINSLLPMGGARLSWQGRPVAMLCYRLDDKNAAYLFVVNENEIPGRGVPNQLPTFSTAKALTTASWKRGDKIYFLAAPVPETKLRDLIQDVAAQYERPGGASTILVRWISHLKSSDSL